MERSYNFQKTIHYLMNIVLKEIKIKANGPAWKNNRLPPQKKEEEEEENK